MKNVFIFLLCSVLSILSFSQEEFTLEHKKEISTVRFSNDGKLACGTALGSIYTWNVNEKVRNNYFEQGKETILTMSFTNNGEFLASAGKDKKIHVWDVTKGIDIYSSKPHLKDITASSFSSDNKFLAHASIDGELVVEDVKSHEIILDEVISKKGVNYIEFSHKSHLLVVGDNEGRVSIYDIDLKSLTKRFSLESGKIRCVKFSPNDRLVAIATDKKKVFMYDLHLGVNIKEYEFHKNVVYNLDFSPDGKYLASCGLDNNLVITDLSDHTEKYRKKGFYKLLSSSFSFDGKYLAVADYTKKVKIINVSFLDISENNDLNRTKKVNVLSAPPNISILSPSVPRGEKYVTDQYYVSIEGTVDCEDGLFMLLVQGKETPVNEDKTFNARVRLKMWDNDIQIKAIDNSKQVSETSLKVYKQTDEEQIVKEGLKRQGVDYALIIGGNEYDSPEWSSLVNPVFDAKAIEKELKNTYGFQTELILNPLQSTIFTTLRTYSKKRFSDQDQLFIFIAGHGEYDNVFKEGYLVCKDTKPNDIGKQSYINHSTLRTYVANINCKHIFLVMDACFGGTFDPLLAHRGSSKGEKDVSKDQFILRKMKHKTRQYLTSGGKEYVPDGRPGQHSPFARKFLESLRSEGGTDGVLTISEVMTYVDKVTPEPRHGEFTGNEPGSEFLFIKK